MEEDNTFNHCNTILSHAVFRVLDMVDPPKSPPTPPPSPRFVLRASAVGKPFTGKTTALEELRKGDQSSKTL